MKEFLWISICKTFKFEVENFYGQRHFSFHFILFRVTFQCTSIFCLQATLFALLPFKTFEYAQSNWINSKNVTDCIRIWWNFIEKKERKKIQLWKIAYKISWASLVARNWKIEEKLYNFIPDFKIKPYICATKSRTSQWKFQYTTFFSFFFSSSSL